MKVRRIDMLAELNRMARNKKPTLPAQEVARWAVQWVKAGLAQTEIEQLERLYHLEDPRA